MTSLHCSSRNSTLHKCSCVIVSSFLLLVAIQSFIRPVLCQIIVSAENQSSIYAKSFSVRSTVRVSINRDEILLSRIQESYSLNQRRARIKFELESQNLDESTRKGWIRKPEEGSFYYDGDRNIMFLVSGGVQKCSEWKLEDFSKHIFFHDLDLKEPIADVHIIGPARLLPFVDKHRHEMQLVGDRVMEIQNYRSIMYTFDYYGKSRGKTTVNVVYSQTALAADKDAAPIQIIMYYPSNETLIIDYFHFEPLEEQSWQSVNLKQGASDEFAFPLGVGCSEALTSVDGELLFAERSPDTSSFSFKASMEFEAGYPAKNFKVTSQISYSGALNSMREDMLSISRFESKARHQIYNFKLNRMYHVMELFSENPSPLNKLLELSRDNPVYGDEGDNAINERTQCVVARIAPNDKPTNKRPFSIGQLLVGADRFVYMGRAQVRGIDAFVYEAQKATLPFWIEHSVEYSTLSGKTQLRDPVYTARADSHPNIKLVSFVYLAEKEVGHPIILIDYQKMADGSGMLLEERLLVHVHDFMWYLDESQNGVRVNDLFSLADCCSAGLGRNQYAKVSMLLESREIDKSMLTNNLLKFPQQRDLALLSSLQDSLQLPATMIYDLESRMLSTEKSISNDGELMSISLSFRVAEHTDNLVALLYLGQGRLNRDYTGGRSLLIVRSFRACYMFAAHRRANIYFGYNSKSRACALDLVPISNSTGAVGGEKPASFIMDPKYETEVFRTNHFEEIEISKATRWVRETSDAIEKFRFTTPTLKLRRVRPQGDVLFDVKKIHVNDADYKTSIAGDQKNSRGLETDKILGFGLDENGVENKLVMPVFRESITFVNEKGDVLSNQVALSNVTEMTYEQCHAACLSDFNCQSFSTCIRRNKMICVTSELYLRLPSLVVQLNNEKMKHSKRRMTKINVTLDDGNEKMVELIQDPNCQLYNKNFIELFKQPKPWPHIAYNKRRVYGVGSQEDCAKLCFQRSMEVLKEGTNSIKNLLDAIGNKDKGDYEKYREKLHQLFVRHDELGREVCKEFLYLDSGSLYSEPREVLSQMRERVIGWDDETDSNRVKGYCISGDHQTLGEIVDLKAANKFNPEVKVQYLDMEMYQFKLETFYEQQYGVRLRESPMSEEEKLAYKMVKWKRNEATKEMFTIMENFVRRGDNAQEVFYASGTKCAESCFLMRAWGPWPSCRSFDVTYRLEAGFYKIDCHLNSITLHQARASKRLDLIEYLNDVNPKESDFRGSHSKLMQLWHYEPRPGFSFLEAELETEVSMLEDQLETSEHATEAHVDKLLKSNVGGTFLGLLVVGLATVSGLLLGVCLGSMLVTRGYSLKRHSVMFAVDEKNLIDEPATSIQFKEQMTMHNMNSMANGS